MIADQELQTRLTCSYDVAGPIDAPAIVLVHGSTVTRKSWFLQVKAFQHLFRVIAVDLPGHGSLAGERFDMETAVSLLNKVASFEVNGKAMVAGISLGGHVATIYAARFPEQVAALVLSGASSNMKGGTGLWLDFVGRIMPLMNKDRLRSGLEKSLRAKWPLDVVDAQIADGLYPDGAWDSFRQISKYDYFELIGRLTAPVLILNGELDKLNRKAETAFSAATKNGQVRIVTGAGHACNVERPEEYNRLLIEFAERIGWIRS